MTGTDDGGGLHAAGALAVAVLGLVLALGFTWNFTQEVGELSALLAPLAGYLLGLLLSGSLVYLGLRHLRPGYTLAESRRVAAWTYAGATAVTLVVGFTVVIRLAEGRTLAEPALEVLVGAAGGALAGFVAGQENVRAHRQVAEVERARDSMAFLNRTLRHEVLNGIQLVSGHAANLDDHVEGSGGETSVETIAETSDELSRLLDDVGRVADVHAGDADLGPVDAAESLTSEVARLDSGHPDATITLDGPEHAEVRANDALAHVFRNLLANAVEHNDGEAPTVRVSVDVGPEVVTVAVADDGPGIPDDRRADLFDPAEGGTHGFGLHLVRTLVEGYGGEIAVSDNDPRGTVFAVDLPRPETPTTGMFDGGAAVGRTRRCRRADAQTDGGVRHRRRD